VNQAFAVGPVSAAPGTKAYGEIPVGELYDGSPLGVPVCVVNGTKDGKVLWLQGGVHGDEYVGLAAMHRLLETIDPTKMTGAVVVVPVANPQAFRAGGRMATQDGMDMNRIWPGNPIEKAMHLWAHSELVVDKIWAELHKKATHLIDCHDGGGMGKMSPFAIYNMHASIDPEAYRAYARSTGFAMVWEIAGDTASEKFPGGLGSKASSMGIPSLTAEVGGQQRIVGGEVDWFYNAIDNVLKHLKIVDGNPKPNPDQIRLGKASWIRANRGGVLYIEVEPLQRVNKGDRVGVIRDLFGRVVEELWAPGTGIVIGTRTLGVVATGQYVMNVGEPIA
jgi:predicted deacylase